MQYIVEASLNEGEPRLRIVEAQTGKTRLEWNLVKVNKMFETGEIKREDFLKPKRYGMQLLVKNLFLLSCIETFKSGGVNNTQIEQLNLQYKIGPK